MTRRTQELDAQLYAGIAWFRSAAWVWAIAAAALSRNRMTNPGLAWVVLICAGAVTLGLLRIAVRKNKPMSVWVLSIDLATGALLLAADGWVYASGRPQSLATAWPVAAILAVGVALGARFAFAAALLMAVARGLALAKMVGSPAVWGASQWLSILSTLVLYAVAGAAASIVAVRIRAAEGRAARAAAREEVARDLHDGMLQTLAAIQRRSNDPALVRLARTQEADLRTYLFADDAALSTVEKSAASQSVEGTLRRVCAEATARWGITAAQAYVAPIPTLHSFTLDALAQATAEGLANAAKHSGVDTVNVLVEAPPDEASVIVTVRDRGCGFDAETTTQRGLLHSVSDRLNAVDGDCRIESALGKGTQLRLRVPIHPRKEDRQ